jgi:glycosyltransferase involved in cell wall biosynthesis
VNDAGLDIPGPAASIAGELERPLRTAVVGMSVSPICGVRAHSSLLADALNRGQMSCSLHWLLRSGGPLRSARAEIRDWAHGVARELGNSRHDAIVLAYSVFEYSYRGVPLFARPVLSALLGTGVPLIVVLHELVYPWRRGGWRGGVWALTQRAALVEVMRAASGVIVTADFQAARLRSRRWLPRRPVAVAPVFSNLPPPAAPPRPVRSSQVVGLFGYSYEGIATALVLDALRLLRSKGMQVELILLGAPGPHSPSARAWLQAAQSRGLDEAVSFSGTLPPQALSDALASCDALLFADTAGPSSRKGSLAAALASGRPVIAIDGRLRWTELIDFGAASLVPPTARDLADAIRAVLIDEGLAHALGASGRLFAERRMGVTVTSNAVIALVADISGADAS